MIKHLTHLKIHLYTDIGCKTYINSFITVKEQLVILKIDLWLLNTAEETGVHLNIFVFFGV